MILHYANSHHYKISCSFSLLFPDSCLSVKDLVSSYSFVKLSLPQRRLLASEYLTIKENCANLIPCNTSEKLNHIAFVFSENGPWRMPQSA